jgi:hypothetical protein
MFNVRVKNMELIVHVDWESSSITDQLGLTTYKIID